MSSGDPAAAGAAIPDERDPLSVRLLRKGSLAGAVVVAGVALAYGLVLPLIAAQVAAPAPPRIVDLGGGVTVTVDASWSEADGADGEATLTQGGSVLVLHEPRPAEALPAQEIEEVAAARIAEAPDGAVATAPRAFETDAGDRAATIILQEPLQTVQAWVVSDGDSEVVAVLTSPATGWEAASAAAQVLLRSLEFPEEAP